MLGVSGLSEGGGGGRNAEAAEEDGGGGGGHLLLLHHPPQVPWMLRRSRLCFVSATPPAVAEHGGVGGWRVVGGGL